MNHTEHLTKYIGQFVDALWRGGMTDVVISPGSRSTPLAMLCTEHDGLNEWIIIDERSAAFFALGLAKQTKRPVGLICTSGTAAANYFPAIVEAYYSRVPLVVMTADRPHELRDVGAPQAIEQIKLYGDYVKWFQEMALPEATQGMLEYVRNKAVRAIHMAKEGNAGAVHLNFPLREPLIPDLEMPDKWLEKQEGLSAFHTEGQKQLPAEDLQSLTNEWQSASKGLFVCGPQPDRDLAAQLVKLAAKWGWPILADPLSQVRSLGGTEDVVIETYDAVLKEPQLRERFKPDVIVRFGAMPVSKSYLFFVKEAASAKHYIVEPSHGHREPAGLPSQFIYADPVILCKALNEQPALPKHHSQWLEQWQSANQTAAGILQQDPDILTEGQAVRMMVDALPENSTLYVGNSMAIRDLDSFLVHNHKSFEVLANRGANGIDGMISSGVGAAAAKKRVTLLLGDLSFFHDMNGLLAAKHYELDVTILLINNNGAVSSRSCLRLKKASTLKPCLARLFILILAIQLHYMILITSLLKMKPACSMLLPTAIINVVRVLWKSRQTVKTMPRGTGNCGLILPVRMINNSGEI
ncbi:2-succinyl-5-enolpyruvyl-6-hydroxy-3-cyclohexene-1-carboxylic-acidsynthase [Lentibacillus sp. JNUCC-1]|uniref:2-succinyl-5-enolpyruvyl-6-hydroxy-3- cyclohexene-1-carboxylic-acid synthase n=1 Tax=Lentibacillus sp. JNUCC-1 TaxID=2654513 RepID=UPI001329DF67|nr:2-succinyl-5-enolpyruvyl-6-hydroxy-3-cyclohexene-1-carboxylic-acidsynthase [Lentibacillus sp. JNUCC-1]